MTRQYWKYINKLLIYKKIVLYFKCDLLKAHPYKWTLNIIFRVFSTNEKIFTLENYTNYLYKYKLK